MALSRAWTEMQTMPMIEAERNYFIISSKGLYYIIIAIIFYFLLFYQNVQVQMLDCVDCFHVLLK